MPALDSLGRPPLVWSKEVLAIRQRFAVPRVFIGDEDRTYFRGHPVVIESWSNTEPFGDGPARLSFPQISPFERSGFGDLDWLFGGQPVDLAWLYPDDSLHVFWSGMLLVNEAGASASEGQRSFDCVGALWQADLTRMKRRFSVGPVDIGRAIPEALNGVVGRRYAPIVGLDTGLLTQDPGSGEQSVLGWVGDILATATTDDGEGQWTIRQLAGQSREFSLILKNRTYEHWSVAMGLPGVTADLSRDLGTSVNVIYGSGTRPDGGRWAGWVYPKADQNGLDRLDAVYRRPLVTATEVEPHLYDADGGITGPNPAYDPTRVRIERDINYGTGITRAQATASARRELRNQRTPGWTGTVTLACDPEEGARWQIRAGENIRLRHFDGPDGTLLHIASVTCNLSAGTVTLTVDEEARDLMTLSQIIERNRETAGAVNRAPGRLSRRSKIVPDQVVEFDAESPGGIIDPVPVVVDGWRVDVLPLAQVGRLVKVDYRIVPATRFCLAVFGAAITPAQLDAIVPEPLVETDSGASPIEENMEALEDLGLIEAWGGPGQAAGYWPGQEGEDNDPTGRLVDTGSVDFVSARPPWVWVAVWSPNAGTGSGRLFPAPVI